MAKGIIGKPGHTYGGNNKNGGNTHTKNKGVDRTPAQKAGDKKRRK